MATTNKNFKVKNGLDVNGPIGVGSTPSYGSAGQVLTSQGTGSVPTWTTVSSSGLTATDYVVTGKLSSDQTVASNTNDVLISFVDDFDPQSWWNATSKQFTPNVAGYYNIALHVWWTAAGATTNQYNVQIRKNSNTSAIFQNQTVTGSGSSQGGSRIVYLNGTTDYVDFTAYNGDASTRSLQWGGAGQGTWFSAALMTAGKGDKGDQGDPGASGNSFETISANGTSVVAESSTDTLTITPGDNVQIAGNATSDTITFTVNGALSNISSIITPNYITFDTTPTGVSTAAGTMYWDDGDGIAKAILNANVTIGLGQESVITVKNATGSTITKGTVVYINGAQGQMPTVALANASTETTSSKTFGFAAESIADGAEGFLVTEGVLRGVNTDGFTEGESIWLSSTAGQYTQTIPAEPAHSVFLGYAVKAHASAGEVIVKIQNGYELTELHGVTIANTAATNDILQLNSSGIWVNANLATANIANLAAATNIFTGNVNATTFSGSGAGLTSIPSLVTSDTKPSPAVDGQVWFNSATGKTYVYYDDSTSSQWVEVFGAKDIVDLKNRTIAVESNVTAVQSNIEVIESDITTIESNITSIEQNKQNLNYIINGGFEFWQRGTSSTANAVYIADRWIHSRSSGSHTVSQSTDVPTAADVQYSLSFASNGTPSTTNPTITQRIESVNSAQFAGQTVTLSVWAKSTSGASAAIAWSASYPTATDNWASETADTSGTFAASMTNGVWTRYSATFTANALATRGYAIKIYRTGAGVTTTLYAGVQLEFGSTATPFRRAGSTYTEEQAACWRYYQRHITILGRTDATGVWKILGNPIGEMLRATPTSVIVGTISTPAAGGNIGTNVTLTLSGRDMYYTSTGTSSNGAWLNFDDVKVECEL